MSKQPFERQGIDTKMLAGAFDRGALGTGRVHSVENQRVPEQDAEGGDRIQQEAAQQIGIRHHAAGLLAEPQQLGAQVVLHLGAVEEPVVEHQRGDHVLSVEYAVAALDVVELDGEAVG